MKYFKLSMAALAVVFAAALTACGAPSAPEFVQKAAMSDAYEVEAGKIATEKGQSDQVKQFGHHMVDAHTKTTQEVKSIVKSDNIKVDLPTKLDSKHQNLIDDLNEARFWKAGVRGQTGDIRFGEWAVLRTPDRRQVLRNEKYAQ